MLKLFDKIFLFISGYFCIFSNALNNIIIAIVLAICNSDRRADPDLFLPIIQHHCVNICICFLLIFFNIK